MAVIIDFIVIFIINVFFGDCGSGYLNSAVLITNSRVSGLKKIRKRGKSKDVYCLSIIGQLN